MEFDNSFEVPLPPAEAWKVLLDIQRIAPCMPGAELTEVLGDNTYKGKIGVRLGPVALTFAGIVKFDEIDNVRHTAKVSAQGTDAKGRGGANASSTFHLEPVGTGSKVLVHTNLTLSGAVAQYGRGVGIIQATATQIMNQFAKCLKDKLGQELPAAAPPQPPPASAAAAASATPLVASSPSIVPASAGAPVPPSPPPPPPAAAAAKPISGFSLMAKVLWASIVGLFKRS
jgi:carbon monoxide dehydrogenase subunit G